MKQAAAVSLSDSVIYCKKNGFPTPLPAWLRDPAAAPLYERLLKPDTLLAEYTSPAVLRLLCERRRGGVEDAMDRVWRLLNLRL